ncbi:MAG: histidine phosphatase family protein [Clostridiales bacterium]|nr:histidine phosphatase family protein [Clostridiales bacterium]
MGNCSDNSINLILIRHGATKSNKERRYLGRTDESLSEEGIKELLEYKKLDRYPNINYLFTSPMKRCVETAKILFPKIESIIIPEWKEIDFGEFEGKNYIELKDDVRYQAWIDSNGTLPFPKGESREAFAQRCCSGFQSMIDLIYQIVDKCENVTKDIGLVVHGGTIMALLSHYNGGGIYDYQVPNGGGFVCRLKGWHHRPEITELKKI